MNLPRIALALLSAARVPSISCMAILVTVTTLPLNAYTTEKSGQSDTIFFSKYFIQNNAYSPVTGWSQKIGYTSGTSFGWWGTWPYSGGGVRSYPSVVWGKWGINVSSGSYAVKIADNKNFWTEFTWIGAPGGKNNAIYNIWTYGSGSLSTDAKTELLIMTYVQGGAGPTGTATGRSIRVTNYYTNTTDTYDEYYRWATWNNSGRGSHLISYLRRGSVKATSYNLRDFINFASGYKKSDGTYPMNWSTDYVGSVQAGHEIWDGSVSYVITKWKCDVN
jgi:hypothetical protein